MLKRQKMLLRILDEANRPLTHVELVKAAFLLRYETVVLNEAAFYDFVPYRFGPFSFALYRELGALSRDGYVTEDENSVQLVARMRGESRRRADEIPAAWKAAIRHTVAKYLSCTQEELLRDVYRRYPWFALKSELGHLVAERSNPPTVPIAVYTVGYEGKSVDGFFNGLLVSGIEAILDVRANPISRKYGFARKSMSEIARKLGIAYFHLPELGISSDDRSNLSDFASYQRLLDRYEQEMLPTRASAVSRATQLLNQKPSALLCMERDVRCCHRGRLALAVGKQTGLPVSHL
ncbi:MAG: DUF488 family protein [Planctomycetes bacterium]|nr:DUF488 family protein [Planctomycetota bacterium]